MTTPFLPALIVFGVMFLIALFGLMRSSAAASRITASAPQPYDNQTGHNAPMARTTQTY